jgi:hypothetical protein
MPRSLAKDLSSAGDGPEGKAWAWPETAARVANRARARERMRMKLV